MSGWWFIKLNNEFISPDPEPAIIGILYECMVAAPPNFRGDLKISDQNNCGGPEQKIKFGWELNLRWDLKF